MDVAGSHQVKTGVKKCEIEGCSELTVGCRTLLCRRHRNTKYKQNYKKKKRKTLGSEEKHRERIESQLAEEKYLLERKYASMLQQVLIQKRLDVLNSSSVVQLLRNHQQKVREEKQKEMEEKRKQARTQPEVDAPRPSNACSASNERTPPSTGSVTEAGAPKPPIASSSAVPTNQSAIPANTPSSVMPTTNAGVSAPVMSNAVMPASVNAGTMKQIRPGPSASYSSPVLMPLSTSGTAATMPRLENYGVGLAPENFALPSGSLVRMPVQSVGSAGSTQELGSAALFPRMAAPVGNSAVLSKDITNVLPARLFEVVETSKQPGSVQTMGSSDIVVWVGKDGAFPTTKGNPRILPAPALPTGNSGFGQVSSVGTSMEATRTRPWGAGGYMAIAPTSSSVVAGGSNTGTQVQSTTVPYVRAVVRSPEKRGTGHSRSQGSLARGVPKGVVPIAIRKPSTTPTRGVIANRLILPHNAAANFSCSAVVNSMACADGVRQLSLSGRSSASVGSVPRPILPCASFPGHGLQATVQRTRSHAVTTATHAVTTATRYLKPAQQPILPNRSSAPPDYGSVRIPCGAQIRPTIAMQPSSLTPVAFATLPIQQTGRLPGNQVPQQQNVSACLQGNQQVAVNYCTTSMAIPQTVNHLVTVPNPCASLSQQGVGTDLWLSEMQTGRSSIQSGIMPSQDDLLFQTSEVSKETSAEMTTPRTPNPVTTLEQLMAEGPWALTIGL